MSGAKRGDLRTFYALWPDAATRAELALRASVAARATGGRAPRADTLHLTLVFVGATPPERVPALIDAMESIASPAFDLHFDRSGSFRRRGVAWLGMHAIPEPLAELQSALARGAARIGFSLDVRPYAPHLTLARDASKPLPDRLFPPLAWRVESFVLLASELSPEGPRYHSLHETALGAAPAVQPEATGTVSLR